MLQDTTGRKKAKTRELAVLRRCRPLNPTRFFPQHLRQQGRCHYAFNTRRRPFNRKFQNSLNWQNLHNSETQNGSAPPVRLPTPGGFNQLERPGNIFIKKLISIFRPAGQAASGG
jgi:hypothetical protein